MQTQDREAARHYQRAVQARPACSPKTIPRFVSAYIIEQMNENIHVDHETRGKVMITLLTRKRTSNLFLSSYLGKIPSDWPRQDRFEVFVHDIVGRAAQCGV